MRLKVWIVLVTLILEVLEAEIMENPMYDDLKTDVSETVEIAGYPFWATEITANEAYNRRETNRQSILGGTEHVTRSKYVPRDYTFTTYIHIPEGRPDAYDDIFKQMSSMLCEVISPYMGGKFYAEVIINKTAEESSPEDLQLEIQVIEVPERDSNIINDSLTIPEDKLESE